MNNNKQARSFRPEWRIKLSNQNNQNFLLIKMTSPPKTNVASRKWRRQEEVTTSWARPHEDSRLLCLWCCIFWHNVSQGEITKCSGIMKRKQLHTLQILLQTHLSQELWYMITCHPAQTSPAPPCLVSGCGAELDDRRSTPWTCAPCHHGPWGWRCGWRSRWAGPASGGSGNPGMLAAPAEPGRF